MLRSLKASYHSKRPNTTFPSQPNTPPLTQPLYPPAFQPPPATTETISSLQAALATRAAAPTQPGPSNVHLAPLSGTIPTMPDRSSSLLRQLVNSLILMNCCMQLKWTVGMSQHSVYGWARVNTWPYPGSQRKHLNGSGTSCLPLHFMCLPAPPGADMLAYLYVIASAHQEFHFAACMANEVVFMANEVVFRKKAANFRLSSWGHIDPLVYSKAFTGSSR